MAWALAGLRFEVEGAQALLDDALAAWLEALATHRSTVEAAVRDAVAADERVSVVAKLARLDLAAARSIVTGAGLSTPELSAGDLGDCPDLRRLPGRLRGKGTVQSGNTSGHGRHAAMVRIRGSSATVDVRAVRLTRAGHCAVHCWTPSPSGTGGSSSERSAEAALARITELREVYEQGAGGVVAILDGAPGAIEQDVLIATVERAAMLVERAQQQPGRSTSPPSHPPCATPPAWGCRWWRSCAGPGWTGRRSAR